MDWLTFIAELVKATAWPVIVLIVVLVFRGELSALFGRLRKGKIGGAEFEFEDAVAELRADSVSIPEVRAVDVAAVSDNPRTAVLEAWLRVEDCARTLAGAQGISPSLVAAARAPVLIKAIVEKNLLSPEQVQLFHDLRRLRNQVASVREFSPSSESVVSYISLANGLAAAIERRATSKN